MLIESNRKINESQESKGHGGDRGCDMAFGLVETGDKFFLFFF